MPDTKAVQSTTIFAGALVDSTDNDVESRISEEESAEIRFGVLVAEGANSQHNGALLLAAQADEPAGVVVHSHAYSKPVELGDTGLKPGVMLGTLRRGYIWVTAVDAVNPEDPVRYRAVATGNEVAGSFQTAADGNDTVDISSFARWGESAGAGELVPLWIDMLQRADRVND